MSTRNKNSAPEPAHPLGWYGKLSDRQRLFVDEYLIDLNGLAAARRAGYTRSAAYDFLNRADIQNAIKERRDLIDNDRSLSGARFVLNKLWDVATADPRELTEVRQVPCRYCWGVNQQYQFTKTEMDRLLKAHAFGTAGHPIETLWPCGAPDRAAYAQGMARLPFDSMGGEGYTTARDPNAECTECAGQGVTLHIIHDTRKLSPEAFSLFRGVSWSPKDGKFEVRMANQDFARDQLAKHYGIAVERKEIFVRTFDPSKLSDDELTQGIVELESLTLGNGDYHEVTERPKLGRPK
jgi:hypothetical protein